MSGADRRQQCRCLIRSCRSDSWTITLISQQAGLEAVKFAGFLTVDVMVLFACFKRVVLGSQETDGM